MLFVGCQLCAHIVGIVHATYLSIWHPLFRMVWNVECSEMKDDEEKKLNNNLAETVKYIRDYVCASFSHRQKCT